MKTSNLKTLIEYLEYCENELKFSQLSLSRYESFLKIYFTFLDEHNLSSLNVDNKDMKIFITGLYDLGYEATTIQNCIAILKSYYHFLLYKQYISINPTNLLVYPKNKKKLPKTLYTSEINDILKAIDTTSILGRRNYALILVLYSTGMRVSELCDLKLKDVYLDRNEIYVTGKGNKQRIVFYNSEVKEIFSSYIETTRLEILNNKDNEYVFLNSKGDCLTPRGVSYIINKITNDAALLTKVTPHMFRHSLATKLLEEGMDIMYIKEILGHNSISTTQIYTHVSKKKMKEKYNMHSRRRK